MEQLKFTQPDAAKLTTLFEDLEFRTLMVKFKSRNVSVPASDQESTPQPAIQPAASPKPAANDGFHGDLFDLFQPDIQPVQEFSNLKDWCCCDLDRHT